MITNTDTSLVDQFLSTFNAIINSYMDPTNETLISNLLDELHNSRTLDDNLADSLDALDYALWAGPELSTLTEENITSLKKFQKAVESYNLKEAKEHMNALPVPIIVSLREFINANTNFFN